MRQSIGNPIHLYAHVMKNGLNLADKCGQV